MALMQVETLMADSFLQAIVIAVRQGGGGLHEALDTLRRRLALL